MRRLWEMNWPRYLSVFFTRCKGGEGTCFAYTVKKRGHKGDPLDLPGAAHRIARDQIVGRKDDHAMDLRLTDEHPVKGVTVVIREFGQMQNSIFCQSKTFDAVGFALGRDVLRGGPGQHQATQSILDADFPVKWGKWGSGANGGRAKPSI